MLIAGNWKMFKGPAEAGEFCRALRDADLRRRRRRRLPAVRLARRGGAGARRDGDRRRRAERATGPPRARSPARSRRRCCASSASTGRSSATPSAGSSSARPTRRSRAGSRAALEHGLHVIACVGETEAEREAGETEAVLRRQVGRSPGRRTTSLVIAYEPVWAIGTGKTATPEIAQEAHAFVKSILDVPVLYGGSVKPDNAAELAAQPDVDGALVGGASLDVESFATICRAALSLS